MKLMFMLRITRGSSMDKASRIGFEEEEEDEEQDRCCVYRSNKRGEGKGNYLGGKKKIFEFKQDLLFRLLLLLGCWTTSCNFQIL